MMSLNTYGYDSIHIDLNNRWRTSDAKSTSLSNKNVLHLNLEAGDNGLLKIKSFDSFTIFIENQLIANNIYSVSWNLDSLKSIYVFPIDISVFSKSGLNGFNSSVTHWSKFDKTIGKENKLTSTITIAAFSLIWVLISLFYTNRAVTMEYFNFIKFFSVRSIDESILSQRVTSLNNLFVYFFCSALIATNLILLGLSPISYTAEFTLVNILILTIGILAALLAKILTIILTTRIFNQKEAAPTQLFNFVKLMLGCFIISTICLFVIFVFDLDKAYWRNGFRILISTMMGIYLVLTFMRLIRKGGFTVFHLFSYLCISEIFPGLLLLKIYYF